MFNWFKNSDNSDNSKTPSSEFSYTPQAVVVTFILGFIAIITYGLDFDTPTQVPIDLPIISRISVAALAAASSGWVIGFLFGIPRAKPPGTQDQSKSAENGTNNNYQSQEDSFFQYNNNLSDVSDWLTKILVGITLTQVDAIKANFGQIIDFIVNENSTDKSSDLKGFVFTVVIYFIGVGAFSGFLWAVYEFGSNYQLSQRQLDKVLEKERTRVNDLIDSDSKLRQLVSNQLNPKTKEVDQAKLNTAIKKASKSVRSDVATRTIEFRREKWDRFPDTAARTIRIFKGLIDENPSDYDQTYAELAYAQKDKWNLGSKIDKNDLSLLEEAKLNLEKAISIRNKQKDIDTEQIDQYYIYYELNLAQCLIQLGEQDENRISQLLDIAAKSGVLDVTFLNRIRQDGSEQPLNPVIRKWILDHENFGSGKKYPEAIEKWRTEILKEQKSL